jgi:hypothetical protein
MGIGLDGVGMIRVEVHRLGCVEVIELRPPVQGSIDLEIGQRELPPESGWRVWEPDGTGAVRLKAAGEYTARFECQPIPVDLIELGAWLRNQFSEDEQVARAAASLCGCHSSFPTWEFHDDEHEGRIMIVGDPHSYHESVGRPGLCRRWNRSYNDMSAARHITRWDPERVLAEIKAKRELLVAAERYSPYALRYLALPYRNRPGYRQEWRP